MPPAGAYAQVIAWNSGQEWFDAVMDALATPAGERARQKAHVAAGTLLMVARADWLSADARTGRGVATAHETVAKALGMSSKTVQRSRQLLEALGFAVTVVQGRYLTVAERQEARGRHGGHQIKAASLRALTLPKPSAPVSVVYLPSGSPVSLHSHLPSSYSRHAAARRTAAPRPQLSTTRKEKGRPARSGPVRETPQPISVQKLAAELAQRVSWLDSRRHIGSLCRVLVAADIDGDRWTARGLVETLDRFAADRRMVFPERTKNPLGFLRWMLSHALPQVNETPDELRAQRDLERRQRIERQAAEREAERIRVAAIDQADVDRIISEMRAADEARRRERRDQR